MSFASLFFLTGGLAVGVPVLIHLIRRRKWEQISIGSLRFLQEATRTSRRLSRVENIPLLILRILMILLIALLFSRPFLESKEKEEPEREGQVLVLLDSSGSLVGSQKEALELAEEISKQTDEEALRLASFADEVWEIEALDDYEPIAGSPTNWERVVEWVSEVVEGGSISKVVVVTDGREGGMAAEPTRLWPSQVEVEFERVRSDKKVNAAIGQVELLTKYRGEEVVFEARVEVVGDWKGSAKLVLEDGREATATVPKGGGRLVFVLEASEEGGSDQWLRGKVELKPKRADAWKSDDVSYFCALERVRKRVLILDGDPGVSPYSGEGYYLRQALRSSGRGKGQSPFLPVIRNDFRLSLPEESEEEWDAIVFCNWSKLTEEDVEILVGWRDAGTGLMIVLGDQTEMVGYHKLREAGLFPESLARQEVAIPRALGEISDQSLAMTSLGGLGIGLSELFLRDGFRLTVSDDWVSALSLRGGGELLLEKQEAEKGLVLIVTHPLTREWGDFPISRWFVPLVTEWMKGVTAWQGSELEVQQLVAGHQRPERGIFEDEFGVKVINADSDESQVSILKERELMLRLGVPLEARESEEGAEREIAGAPQERERPHEIWPWILIVLILLGSFEIWFSDFRKPQATHS